LLSSSDTISVIKVYNISILLELQDVCKKEFNENFLQIKMSRNQEYPVVLGEQHSEFPKKTDARYILLPDCKIYRKEAQLVFCQKCDVKHKVYDWVCIIPKSTIGFIDVDRDTVQIINPPRNFSQVVDRLKLTNVGAIDMKTGLLTYTITIINISPNSIRNISIISYLPNVNSKWMVIQPRDKCQINKNELHCDLKNLSVGQTFTIKVSASIFSFCGSGMPNREVFNTVHVTAEKSISISNESNIIMPCL
jgi:hypothetical protein